MVRIMNEDFAPNATTQVAPPGVAGLTRLGPPRGEEA